jgi:hypothetical protein
MFALMLLVQTIITLDKPISKDKYELKLDFEVKIESEFYNKTNSSLTPNGELIVLDIGNKKIKVFNRHGKLLRSFGSEGNGPGEFAGVSSVRTAAEMFCITDVGGPSFFDYNFKHLFDTNYSHTKNRSLIIKNAQFIYAPSDFSNFMKVTESGLSPATKLNVKSYDLKAPKNTNSFFTRAVQFKETKAGLVGVYKTEYIIAVRDSNFELTHIIKKNVDPIYSTGMKVKVIGEPTDAQKKIIAKRKFSINRLSSIRRNVGDTEFGFLIEVTTGKKGFRELDLISHDFEYLAKINLKYPDKLVKIRTIYGKIIMDLKNDEIGPYVQVYDLVKVKN